MTQKIVVAKDGYNAATETNPNNLKFSSDYNTLKYYASGYKDIAYAENPGTTLTYYTSSLSHGLGYEPFFYVFVDPTSSGTYLPCPKLYGSIATTKNFYSYVTTSNIVFVCATRGSTGGNQTARFRYFLFRNNLGF